MNFQTLNIWAILVAAIVAFALGALWFSPPVFGKVWQRANGFGAGEPGKAGGAGMLIAFVLTLVMSANLAMFLNDPKTTLRVGRDRRLSRRLRMGVDGNRHRLDLRASPTVLRAGEWRISHRRADGDGRDPRRVAIDSGEAIGVTVWRLQWRGPNSLTNGGAMNISMTRVGVRARCDRDRCGRDRDCGTDRGAGPERELACESGDRVDDARGGDAGGATGVGGVSGDMM